MAGPCVEKAAQHGRRVEARDAPPVNGPGQVDQRSGVAVGQEGVVRDGGAPEVSGLSWERHYRCPGVEERSSSRSKTRGTHTQPTVPVSPIVSTVEAGLDPVSVAHRRRV